MSLLQEILALSEDVAYQNLETEIVATFESAFDTCLAFIAEHNADIGEDKAVRALEVMAEDCTAEPAGEGVGLGLKESVSAEYQADLALLESLTDETLVGLNDTLAESFEQAVQRILKSGRKLRMTDKDGRKYKTRRRAAEAAVGASMRAAFGKKGMIKKAQAGKKG